MRMTAAIEVAGLRKSFGQTRALDGLDLTVAAGEVHGFLGPNGAGKTTTIRILLGLLRADGGTAALLGDVTLWPNLSGGEIIDLLGRLRGGIDSKHRDELLDRFELDPAKKSRAYSRENRQKVALVAALASSADLLILDEPTSGLDPLMEAVFRETIGELAHDGATVLLSSHILSEVEALCDRVTIIRAGRAVDSGALSDLRHLSRASVDAELTSPAPGLASLAGVHDLDITGSRVRCQVDSSALEELLRQFTAAGVKSLVCRPPTLEELFLRHYGAGPAGPAAPAGVAEERS
jgi:polyether ionophore transport system ATP-binding protein